MLFIFRKLRRSFFLPGKVRTYCAYAAGEIVLIVVGILIALQINNWNEGRLQIGEVKIHLAAIGADLEKEADVLRSQIEFMSIKENAMSKLTEYFENWILPQQEVEGYFGLLTSFPWYQPITSAYEALKDSGLPVTNKAIMEKMTNYYEDHQSMLKSTTDTYEFNYKTHFWEFKRKHFQTYTFEGPVVLKDLPKEELKEDFLVEANALNVMILKTIERMRDLLTLNEDLKTLIDAELADRGMDGEE